MEIMRATRAGKIRKLENERMRKLANEVRVTGLRQRRLTLPKFPNFGKV